MAILRLSGEEAVQTIQVILPIADGSFHRFDFVGFETVNIVNELMSTYSQHNRRYRPHISGSAASGLDPSCADASGDIHLGHSSARRERTTPGTEHALRRALHACWRPCANRDPRSGRKRRATCDEYGMSSLRRCHGKSGERFGSASRTAGTSIDPLYRLSLMIRVFPVRPRVGRPVALRSRCGHGECSARLSRQLPMRLPHATIGPVSHSRLAPPVAWPTQHSPFVGRCAMSITTAL